MLIDPFKNELIKLGSLSFDNELGKFNNWAPMPLGNFVLNTTGVQDIVNIISGAGGNIASILSLFLGDGLFNVKTNGFLIKRDPIVLDGTQVYLFDNAEGTYSINSRLVEKPIKDVKHQYKFFIYPMITAGAILNSYSGVDAANRVLNMLGAFGDDNIQLILGAIAGGTDILGYLKDLLDDGTGKTIVDALHRSWLEVDDYSAFERHETVGYLTKIQNDLIETIKGTLEFISEVTQDKLDELLQSDSWTDQDVDIINRDELQGQFNNLSNEYSSLADTLNLIDPSDLSEAGKAILSQAKTDSSNLSQVNNVVNLSKNYADDVSNNLINLSKEPGIVVDLSKVDNIASDTVNLSKGSRQLKVKLNKNAIQRISNFLAVSVTFNYVRYFDGNIPSSFLTLPVERQEQPAIETMIKHEGLSRNNGLNSYTYRVNSIWTDILDRMNSFTPEEAGYSPGTEQLYSLYDRYMASETTNWIIELSRPAVTLQDKGQGNFDYYLDTSVLYSKGIDGIYNCIRPFEWYFVVSNNVANLIYLGVEAVDASSN